MGRIFTVKKRAVYSKSVEICEQQNSILFPVKTKADLTFICNQFPELRTYYGWRIGMMFDPSNNGRRYSDGSYYNPVTDDVEVEDWSSCAHQKCESYIVCSRGKVYEWPISQNRRYPFICYQRSDHQISTKSITQATTATGFPSTNSQSSTTTGFPTADIKSPTPQGYQPEIFTIAIVVAFIVGLLFGHLYRFCKRRQRLSRRYESNEFVVEYNAEANQQKSRELPVVDEIQQDENNETDYIIPNQVNQQVLDIFGGRLCHVYSEIEGNPNEVRISVDSSQKQQQERNVEEQHNNNIDSEIDDPPNTSSSDVIVATDIQTVPGYATMKSRASCSSVVTSQRKVVAPKLIKKKTKQKSDDDDEYVEMKSFVKIEKNSTFQPNKKNDKYISVSELEKEN